MQGRQVDAIRVALEYAQSAAAGKEIKEPPVADAEDFAAHLQDQGRRKSLRKARKRRKADAERVAGASPAQRPARLSELTHGLRDLPRLTLEKRDGGRRGAADALRLLARRS